MLSANEGIRQPPSVYPLPRVVHANVFDVQSFPLDPSFQADHVNDETGYFFRFHEPRQVINSEESPEFRGSPLRFIRANEPGQEGTSFPSKYLDENDSKDKPTPAGEGPFEQAPREAKEAQGKANVESAQADDNMELRETQAVPADAVAPQAAGDVVVNGAGEPTSMPLDRGSCTRSLP